VIGTVFSAVFYIWMTVVLLGILPSAQLAQSKAPFADAAQLIFGGPAATLIALCATLSAFGTLNGWILLQGQLPFAAARDGLFPASFAQLSRFSTPAFGIIVSSILLTFVLYLNYGANLVSQFTSIVTLTTFSLLMPYLFSAAAELKLTLCGRSTVRKGRLWRAVTIALFAFFYAMIAAFGSGQEAVQLGILLVFVGFPVYALMKRLPSGPKHALAENFSAEMVQSTYNASSPEKN
jgi:APA family basic amino acid/polyamine antiporter